MKFTENSQMVKSVLLLLMAGAITEDEIPNLWNLKEVVLDVLSR